MKSRSTVETAAADARRDSEDHTSLMGTAASGGDEFQKGRSGSVEADAMGWRIFDESLEMIERRYQYFPQRFRWRGKDYRVQRVRECWTVSRRGWQQRVERHFFCVQCDEGEFELYQDVQDNTWHLRRARLLSAPNGWIQRGAAAW